MAPGRAPLLLAVFLLTTLAVAATVGAQGRGYEEPAPAEDRATVDVDADEDGARIHLESQDGAGGDPVTIGFGVENATLAIRAPQQGARLEVILDSFVEYEDEDGNGSFDRTEPVASTWRIDRARGADGNNRSVDWGSPNVTNVTSEGADGRRVVMDTAIGTEGRFEVGLTAFGERVREANTTVGPTGVLLDLAVEYPFQANGTDLALLVTVRTPEGVEIATTHRSIGEDAQGIVATYRGGGEQATNLLVAWQTSAIVDGQHRPVETFEQRDVSEAGDDPSTPQQQQRRRAKYDGEGSTGRAVDNATIDQFTLSYERGERIVHEGKAQVTTASIGTTGDEAPALPIALVLAAVAASGWLRRRAPLG